MTMSGGERTVLLAGPPIPGGRGCPSHAALAGSPRALVAPVADDPAQPDRPTAGDE